VNIILTVLMWYGIASIFALFCFLGLIAYDLIKYGKFPTYNEDDH
jgi:hypothetical protein